MAYKGNSLRIALCLCFAAGGLFLLLFRVDPALTVQSLLSMKLDADVRISSLTLHKNGGAEFIGLSMKGGKLPAPLELDSAYIKPSGINAIGELFIDGTTLRLDLDEHGQLKRGSKDALATLGLVLTGLEPGTARVRNMKLLLNSPLLPGERRLKGGINLLKKDGKYLIGGTFHGGKLHLKVSGRVDHRRMAGTLSLELSTMGQSTDLACELGDDIDGSFVYKAAVEISSERKEQLHVVVKRADTTVENTALTLSWLKSPLLVDKAVLTQDGRLRVDEAELRIAGARCRYTGPLAPGPDSPGILSFENIPFPRIAGELTGRNLAEIPTIRLARLSGRLCVSGTSLSSLSGPVSVVFPEGSVPGARKALKLSGRLKFIDGKTVLTDGSMEGDVVADGWQASLDPQSACFSLRVSNLSAPTFLVKSLLNSFRPSPLLKYIPGGDMLAGFELNIPLNRPQDTRGDLKASFPGVKIELSLIDNGIRIKYLRAKGRAFRFLELSGSLKRPGSGECNFIVQGIKSAPGGSLNMLSASLDFDEERIAFRSTFREAGGILLTCNPVGAGNRHVITGKFREAGFQGEIVLPTLRKILEALAYAKPPDEFGQAVELSLTHKRMKAKARVSVTGIKKGKLSLKIEKCSLKNEFVDLVMDRTAPALADWEGLEIPSISFHGGNGGRLEGSLGFSLVSGAWTSCYTRDLGITAPLLPPLSATGSFKAAYADNDVSGHVAVHLVCTDDKALLRAISCRADLERDRLRVDSLKIRDREGELVASGTIFKKENSPCDIQLKAHDFALNTLPAPITGPRFPGGTLSGSLSISGSLRKPLFRGEITVAQGEFILPAEMGKLDRIGLDIHFHDNSLEIKNARARWKDVCSVDAPVIRLSSVDLKCIGIGGVEIRGARIKGSRMQGHGLSFSGKYSLAGGLAGSLHLERATLQSSSPQLTTKEKLLAFSERTAGILRSIGGLHIRLKAPRNLWARTPSMNAEFGGELLLSADGDECSVDGEIAVIRGELYIQGRSLSINRGHLAFVQDPTAETELPMPRLVLTASSVISGVPVTLNLDGNPLIAQGMSASLGSDGNSYSQDSLINIIVKDEDDKPTLTATMLEELGRKLFTRGLERTLRRLLPFHDIGIGGDLTNEGESPTISMGRYISDEIYINLETGLPSAPSPIQEFKIDFKPTDSNLHLSFARDLTGFEQADTRMAFKYTVRF